MADYQRRRHAGREAVNVTLLPLHIVAGVLALVFGYVALFSAKGATLHRKSGMLFVYAMVTMALLGATIAAVRGVAPGANVPAGLLTAYLVITALTTVRPPSRGSRWLDRGLMLVALTVGLTCFTFGFEALASGGKRSGMAFPFFMFGAVGLLSSVGDFRQIGSGGLRGASRLARHLWRMGFALFIAAGSFFLGPGRIPEALRVRALLAVPVLLPLLAILYWLWRVRSRRTFRGLAGVSALMPAARASRVDILQALRSE
jgi:uncharacterized membrane protein